ncbi:MAG: hypothetical protein KBT20_07365 [Bacteroidales bacterium]|nr:hypothetical protein [Candidatus Liminaster caballi]
MKPYFLFIAAISATALGQHRPDSAMQQTLTIEREFAPIVQKAVKIDRQPAPQEVQASRSEASFADWEADAVRTPDIGVVPAGQIIARPSADSLGYLRLSAGNYWNTDLAAGFHRGDFRIDTKGFFTEGDLKLPMSDELGQRPEWRSMLLTGGFDAAYSHTLSNEAQLTINAVADGMVVNLFPYEYNPVSLSIERTDDHLRTQHGGMAGASIAYETDRLLLRAGYAHDGFTSPYNVIQPFEYAHPLDLRTNTIDGMIRYGWYETSSLWQASIDLPVSGIFANKKQFFTIRPVLHLSFLPADGQWKRWYADLACGTRRDAPYSVMQRLPLVLTYGEPSLTTDIFDLTIGYEDNEQGYLRWGGSVRLRNTEDELCAVAYSYRGTQLKLGQENCTYISADLHVDYEYSRYFGIKANALWQHHSCDATGLGDPELTAAIHLLSHPGKVTLDLGYDCALGRHFQLFNPQYDILVDPYYEMPSNHTLKNIQDLNFRIDWQFRPSFSLFAFGRNLLNQKYELWPNIPAQRINLHAGFSWKF